MKFQASCPAVFVLVCACGGPAADVESTTLAVRVTPARVVGRWQFADPITGDHSELTFNEDLTFSTVSTRVPSNHGRYHVDRDGVLSVDYAGKDGWSRVVGVAVLTPEGLMWPASQRRHGNRHSVLGEWSFGVPEGTCTADAGLAACGLYLPLVEPWIFEDDGTYTFGPATRRERGHWIQLPDGRFRAAADATPRHSWIFDLWHGWLGNTFRPL
jgi:hypothetical protein